MLKLCTSMSPIWTAGAGLEGFEPRRRRLAPIDRRRGQSRHVDGGAHGLVARQDRQAGDVIGMLVRNQDGVDIVERFADRRQALAQFPHAQARVDQDARIFGGQERGVSGTAAGQHAELDDNGTLDTPEYTDSL